MHPRLAPLATLMLVACHTTPAQRLQGKWVGERVENFSAAQGPRADGWAAASTFEFRGSRATISIPAESPREGAFEIAGATPEGLTIVFARPEGGRDRVAFSFEPDGRLRWQLGDGRSVLMRRVSN